MITNNNLKIVFAGGGQLAEPIFAELAAKFDDLTLISKEDKPKGRSGKSEKSPIKNLAESKNIPIFEPRSKDDLEKMISDIKPDLVIVASLGIIITEKTLNIPKYGFINAHFSLLPLHRGPSPVQFTILNGDKKAGITVQKVVPKIDTGDIIFRHEIDLNGTETTESLGKKLSKIATEKMPKIIEDYVKGNTTPQKQNHSAATFSKIIEKVDGKIDWSEPARIIDRKVRAYTPWPGTYTNWHGKILKILEATVSDNESCQKNGTFYEIEPKTYGIQTGKGTLVINKLQLEGKKPLTISDFMLGNSKIVGEILG